MNPKEYIVRIVETPSRATSTKRKELLSDSKHKFYRKITNILAGSSVGFITGMVIYLMLRSSGLIAGGLESSIIIAFPAVLGVLTSYVIF
jgi:hypothetical protein